MAQKVGLVLMTAMPPTRGHRFLIEFAYQHLVNQVQGDDQAHLFVMLNTRSFEPINGYSRFIALQHAASNIMKEVDGNGLITVVHCGEDSVPQNPSEHSDFWNYWKLLIGAYTYHDRFDFVYASESYGVELASTMNAQFIPCNVGRTIHNCSASKIRVSPPHHYFRYIMPEYQPFLKKVITFFGAESCGKSTMTENISYAYSGIHVPEWAREYLELCGTEVTDERMADIVEGQYALQLSAYRQLDHMYTFQDTDLLSTLGYYELYKGKGNHPDRVEELFRRTKSDLYIVMNDQIPFEPDILRYGGNKRESNTQYWIDLLDRYGCTYHVMKSVDPSEQFEEAADVIDQLTNELWEPIRNFVRT